jgi:hypothetical protein
MKETSYSDRRFWVSYILFITIIGRILVLFICITRLASNEIFSPLNKILREVGRAKDLPAPLYNYRWTDNKGNWSRHNRSGSPSQSVTVTPTKSHTVIQPVSRKNIQSHRHSQSQPQSNRFTVSQSVTVTGTFSHGLSVTVTVNRSHNHYQSVIATFIHSITDTFSHSDGHSHSQSKSQSLSQLWSKRHSLITNPSHTGMTSTLSHSIGVKEIQDVCITDRSIQK